MIVVWGLHLIGVLDVGGVVSVALQGFDWPKSCWTPSPPHKTPGGFRVDALRAGAQAPSKALIGPMSFRLQGSRILAASSSNKCIFRTPPLKPPPFGGWVTLAWLAHFKILLSNGKEMI